MKELFGRSTALFSAFALMLTPNLFGYANIAVTDLPLAVMWFLTAYCFFKGLDDWKWSVAFGVVWGLALATKFPALLIPAPLIAWAHIFHRNKYVNNVFAMFFLAPIIMVASQPYLWHQPGLRILEFLYEGISRAYRPETNYTIYFNHQIYWSNKLPWYYPFYMLGVTTPEPFIALAMVGILVCPWLKSARSATLLFLVNAACVPIMALLPGAVLHDGVRQLLSSLPFLVALAGVGFYVLSSWLLQAINRFEFWQRVKNRDFKIIAALFLLATFHPALDLYLVHPFQLSYYNRLVGGIPGAHQRGLEATYFMEAITPQFLRRINDKLPSDATVNASFANFMFEFYQKEGVVRRDIRFSESSSADFYLLLNRRSVLSAKDRHILQSSATVIDAVTVAGVPLVALFDLKKTP
jgi:4-amino-4-deoxy-L-arabinose transferase-like glycosyltransferase